MKATASIPGIDLPEPRRLASRLLPRFLIPLALASAPAAEAQDVMRIGSFSDAAPGERVIVPLLVRDLAGTALDSGAEPQRAIHSFAVTVETTPASAVAALEIVRGGLTADAEPRFETQVAAGPRRSWIASFNEPVAISGGAQVVAHLRLQVAPGAVPGTAIELALVPETTALGNASGTILETGENGGLILVGGTVEVAGAGCTTDAILCLLGDRFLVGIAWTDFDGGSGAGHAVKLTDETGYFWFFGPDNVEVVIKVIDGRGFNGHFWVFYGALSNVEYEITVTDSVTGDVERYFNPARNFASVGDIEAFPAAAAPAGAGAGKAGPEAAAVVSAGSPRDAAAQGGCTPSATRLCLLGDRFALEMSWQDFEGATGVGEAVRLTDETGYFWFFDPENVEIIVKVIDGRGSNGRFWIFYGALSNVEFTLEVTDTETGDRKRYFNPLGTFASMGDIEAF